MAVWFWHGVAVAAIAVAANLTSSAHAADASVDGDFFGDVATDAPLSKASSSADTPASSWSLAGFVKQQFAYALDDQDPSFPFSRERAGVTQARSTLNLALNGRLPGKGVFRVSANAFYDAHYHGAAKDNVTRAEYEDQADEAEWREAFINVEPTDNFWIKTGRQVIAWGESDFTQILDLVNPRDERELGLVDLEDARLPIWATRVSYVGNRWGTDLVVTHEFAPNRLAANGSDFDPYIGLRSALVINDDRDADAGIGRGDVLWRGFASFSKGDVGLIYARVHDHNPILRQDSGGASFTPAYPRIEAAGVTANFIAGYWLLKTEYAHKEGVRFARNDWPAQLATPSPRLYEEKPLDQWLLGVEYSGVADTQLSLESVTARIGDYESVLLSRRTETVWSGRANRNFLHDTASVELVWAHWVDPRADSARLSFSYDISDALKFSIGAIAYSGDTASLLYPYRRNDRLFSSIRYSF